MYFIAMQWYQARNNISTSLSPYLKWVLAYFN